MIKKFLSALLAVLMVVSMVPMAAMATDEGGSTAAEPQIEVTVDNNNALWGDAVKATVNESSVGIKVDLTKLNEGKGTAFAEYLTSSSRYFTYNTDGEFSSDTNGAQLCMPITIALKDAAPTAVTCVRMDGDKNMDEDTQDKTSVSATYSKDSTTVTEWPVVAFAGLTYDSTTQQVSYTNADAPFDFNTFGATGKLNTWKYKITWTVDDKKVTREVTINLTKTPAPIDVVPANLTTIAGKEPPEYGQATEYTAEFDKTKPDQINVTATGLKETVNSNGLAAYWVGVGLTHQENATYAWGYDTRPETLEGSAYGNATNKQTVEGKEYDTLYWGAPSASNTNFWTTKKTGYISVKVGDKTTEYTVKFEVKTKQPEIVAVGYRDSAEKAKEQIKADRLAAEGKTTGDTSAGSDSDIKTMWVVMKDLPVVSDENGAKDYRVHVTEPDGTTAVALDQASSSANKVGPDTAFNTDTGYKAIWWTFNQEATGGTVASKDIQAGEYKFQLQKKTGENDWTDIGESKTLTLAELTVKKSDTDENPDKYYIDTAANKPLTDLGITITEPTAATGKVFRGWKKGNEAPITTEALNALKITADAEYTAVFEDKQDLHVDVATEAIQFDSEDGMDPAKLGTFTVAQADADKVIKVTGQAKCVVWDAFSSEAKEKFGFYTALKFASETNEDAVIKVVGTDGAEKALDEDGVLAVYLVGDPPRNNIKIRVYASSEATTNTEYTLDLSGVKKSYLDGDMIFGTCSDSDKLGEQVLKDLVDNLEYSTTDIAGKVKVLGTAHYTVFPAFHGTNTEQQRGHYVAMKLSVPEEIASDVVIKVNSPTEDIEKKLDGDGIWVIRVENFKNDTNPATPTIRVCAKGSETELYKYQLDLDGLTLEAPKTDATIKSIEIGTAAITISDTPTAGSIYTGIKATFPANTEDSELSSATVKLTIDKDASVRYFNASHNTEPPGEALWANNANIAANNNGTVEITNVKLKWDESQDDTLYIKIIAQDGKNSELYKVTAETSEIAVAPIPAPVPTVSEEVESLPSADVAAVNTAGTNTNVANDSKGALTGSALAAVEKDETKTQEDANAAIDAADGLTLSEGQNALIYVVPSMKVEATKYEKDSSDAVTSYTVDITPIVTVYASTATKADEVKLPGTGVNDANSVQMGQPIELRVLDTPITIEIGVPTALAGNTEKVYIIHKDSDTGTEKERFLETVASGKVSVTVDSFSPFTITKATEAVLSSLTVSEGTLSPAFNPNITKYDVSVPYGKDSITVTGTALASLTGSSVTCTPNSPVALNEGANTIKVKVSATGMTDKEYTVTVTRAARPVTPVGPTTPTTPTTYTVKTPSTIEGGKVSASPTSAAQGATVTLTVTPDEGYELDKLTVTDASGKAVAVTGSGSRYTFTMPGGAVTVSASFKKAAPWQNPFGDVKESAWYYDAVKYVKQNKLMNGNEKGQFEPDKDLTRAEFAAILYNKEGQPATTWSNVFTDVPEGAWFAKQVVWAADKNILAGYGNGKAGPNDPVKREELAVLLWKYEGRPAPKSTTLNFPDAGKVSSWAKDAMLWATENGIINGTTSGGTVILAPQGSASRAESAQMLMNYFGKK